MSKHPFETFYEKYAGIDIKTAPKELVDEFNKDVDHLIKTVPQDDFINYDFQAYKDSHPVTRKVF